MTWRGNLRRDIAEIFAEAQFRRRVMVFPEMLVNYRVNWKIPVDRRPLVDRSRVGKRHRCYCGFQTNSTNGFRKHVHRPRARRVEPEQKPVFWTGQTSQIEALKQAGWF